MRGASRWQYFFYCWLARALWRLWGGRFEIVGRENLPRTGACLLIANHQSYLDPPFLHAIVPRILHPMAKSTQFASKLMGFLLAHVYTFPVRRYQTDPQAVRTVLRRLDAGCAVMIYLEGERTWDGRLQPPRLGVIRLVLKAGVPVIPVRIDGSYEVWPRWARRPRPGTMRFAFGEPMVFPKLDVRRERDAAAPAARARLLAALKGPRD
ncbi:MAG TPA: lysophospholipid acyltransferase family protein [Longimicrobiales bacterium]|nr:lysophospholipid acyltransferase family protein [Longimicrobiales bacterium]